MIRKLLLVVAIGAFAVLWTVPAGAQQYPPGVEVLPGEEERLPVIVQPNSQVPVQVQGIVQTQNGPFAFTGTDALTLVRIALGVITVGGLLVLATRKRVHAHYG